LKFGVFFARANFFPRTTIGIHRILKSYQIIFDQSKAVIFIEILTNQMWSFSMEYACWKLAHGVAETKFRFFQNFVPAKSPFPFCPLTPV